MVKCLQKGRAGMDVLDRLNRLREARGWSMYRLSIESGLSQSTIANVFQRNAMPGIDTLEKICQGFRITLSQFFAEDEMVELSPELKDVFDNWYTLTPEQKRIILDVMKAFNHERQRKE